MDGEPWAITLHYDGPDGPLLTVRTVRSTENYHSHGESIEDLPTALGGFVLRRTQINGPGRAEEHFRGSLTTRRAIERQAALQGAVSVRVGIDDLEVEGEKLDINGTAALRLSWHGQTVLCAGPTSTIASLRLRTGRREDLPGAV
ncbi:hypothetical protein [Streptacidiphilus sp. PAMC 29251]